MTANGEIVKTFDVTRTVSIRAWSGQDPDYFEGGIAYDWVDSEGGESMELSPSIVEAEQDALYG